MQSNIYIYYGWDWLEIFWIQLGYSISMINMNHQN
jgi:hypothetical protein